MFDASCGSDVCAMLQIMAGRPGATPTSSHFTSLYLDDFELVSVSTRDKLPMWLCLVPGGHDRTTVRTCTRCVTVLGRCTESASVARGLRRLCAPGELVLNRVRRPERRSVSFPVAAGAAASAHALRCVYEQSEESKSFGLNAVDDRVLGAVELLGGRVTVADVAARTGLGLPTAQRCLVALANVAGGHLEVSRDGELVYAFPSNVRRVLLQESIIFALRNRWEKISPFLNYLVRISFGILLIASIFIIYTSIVAISSSVQSREDDRRSSYNRSYGGGSLYVWMGPSPFDLIFYANHGYSGRRREGGMSFLESIFSFLFGDGNPNADLETYRWRRIGETIRRLGGAVTAEQIAPLLDVPEPPESRGAVYVDESFMLPVLERFGGRPEVTDDGDIVYVFPDLLNTVSGSGSTSGSASSEQSHYDKGYIEEQEYVFSKASSGQILGAAGLGVLNLLGAVTLGEYMAQLRAVPLPFLKWLYPPLLAYALAFLIIPAVRWYRQRKENERIQRRNRARKAWYQLLQKRDPNVLRKLESARYLRSNLRKIQAEDITYTTAKSLIEQNQELLDDFDKKLH
jgi:hypothetical protein